MIERLADWLGQPENQIFVFGACMLIIGALVMIWLAFPTERTDEPVVIYPVVPEVPIGSSPRHAPIGDWTTLADLTALAEATADAEANTEVLEAITVVLDLDDTVEMVFDPLDSTVELESIDPSAPLFYQIRRPPPYRPESFTEGITRAQIERAKAAKP